MVLCSVNNGVNEGVNQDAAADSAELRTMSANNPNLQTYSGAQSGCSLPCTCSLPSATIDTRDTPDLSVRASKLTMRGVMEKFKLALALTRQRVSEDVEGGVAGPGGSLGGHGDDLDASSSGSLRGRIESSPRVEAQACAQVAAEPPRCQAPPGWWPGMWNSDRPTVTSHELGLIHIDNLRRFHNTAQYAAKYCVGNPVFSENNQSGGLPKSGQLPEREDKFQETLEKFKKLEKLQIRAALGSAQEEADGHMSQGDNSTSHGSMHAPHASALVHSQVHQVSGAITNEESTFLSMHGFHASHEFTQSAEQEPMITPQAMCNSTGLPLESSKEPSREEHSQAAEASSEAPQRRGYKTAVTEQFGFARVKGGLGLTGDGGSETSRSEEHPYGEGDRLETLQSHAPPTSDGYSLDAASRAVHRWLMTTPSPNSGIFSGRFTDTSGRFTDTVPDSTFLSQLHAPPLSPSLPDSPPGGGFSGDTGVLAPAPAPPPEGAADMLPPIDTGGMGGDTWGGNTSGSHNNKENKSCSRRVTVRDHSGTFSYPGSTSQLFTVHELHDHGSTSPLTPQEAWEIERLSLSFLHKQRVNLSRVQGSSGSASMYTATTATPTRHIYTASSGVNSGVNSVKRPQNPAAHWSDTSGSGLVDRSSLVPSDSKMNVNASKDTLREDCKMEASAGPSQMSQVSGKTGRMGGNSQGLQGENKGIDGSSSAALATPKTFRMSHTGTSGFFSANSSAMSPAE